MTTKNTVIDVSREFSGSFKVEWGEIDLSIDSRDADGWLCALSFTGMSDFWVEIRAENRLRHAPKYTATLFFGYANNVIMNLHSDTIDGIITILWSYVHLVYNLDL
jgi:hypothetical protein